MVLGSYRFRESGEKSGRTVRSEGKSWKPGGGEVFVFLYLAQVCSPRKGRFRLSSMAPLDG